MPPDTARRRATLTGFGAVLLWSALALLTVGTAPVPPFLLNTLTFAIGGALGLVWVAATGGWRRLGQAGAGPLLVMTAGLFLYHALYFSALRLAPPAEAGLIAYLWPLLIVLFSGLLPGERLARGHVAGALIAFAGAALIVLRGAGSAIARADRCRAADRGGRRARGAGPAARVTARLRRGRGG